MLSLSLNEIQQQQLFPNGIDQMLEIHEKGEVKVIIGKTGQGKLIKEGVIPISWFLINVTITLDLCPEETWIFFS